MKDPNYPLKIIVAVDLQGGFAKENKIPWYFPEDLKYFKEVTKDSTCIMGSNTYKEILEMKKTQILDLLPGRESIVLSKSLLTEENPSVIICQTLTEAIQSSTKNIVFVIGGEKLFIQALPLCNEIFMTVINGNYDCDKFFRIEYLKKFNVELVSKLEHGINVRYYR